MSTKVDFVWLTLVLVMFSAGFLWWKTWVQPRDQFLFAVMDCMSFIEDHTEDGYDFCAEEVRREGR